jgi:phosphoglycerate dehydrogenase-like enzyme
VNEPLSPDSPLRSLSNVMLTPHIGWTVEEVFAEFADIACTQLLQYMEGNLPAAELLVL